MRSCRICRKATSFQPRTLVSECTTPLSKSTKPGMPTPSAMAGRSGRAARKASISFTMALMSGGAPAKHCVSSGGRLATTWPSTTRPTRTDVPPKSMPTADGDGAGVLMRPAP